MYPSFGEYLVLSDILKAGFGACLGREGMKELIILTQNALEMSSGQKFKDDMLLKMNKDILNINSNKYSNFSYDEKYQLFLNEYKKYV